VEEIRAYITDHEVKIWSQRGVPVNSSICDHWYCLKKYLALDDWSRFEFSKFYPHRINLKLRNIEKSALGSKSKPEHEA
jgi:hypothetical protein